MSIANLIGPNIFPALIFNGQRTTDIVDVSLDYGYFRIV